MTTKQPSWRADKRKTAERGYGAAWQRARAAYLADHPLCVMCQESSPPRITPATVVDHKIPHRGDQALFWDRSGWQAICAPHHNSTRQREDKLGRVVGCDESGAPRDPGHHWNARG